MDAPSATILAALVAGAVALVTVTANVLATSLAAKRAAHREMLALHISELGAAIHECVALSIVLAQRIKKNEKLDTWSTRADAAKKRLEELRKKVKYPLWGLDEGLRVVMRLPDWVKHTAAADESRTARLLRSGEALRVSLDRLIHRSYQAGKPPGPWGCWRARRAAETVENIFEEGRAKIRVAPEEKIRIEFESDAILDAEDEEAAGTPPAEKRKKNE